MRKKKLLNLSAIVLGALMCFSFNKVQAADSVFTDVELTRNNLKAVVEANTLDNGMTPKVLGISKNRRSGDYYQWNLTTTGEGKTVWKIATYSSETDDTANYNDLYYCLNAAKGFGISNGEMAEGAKDTYNDSYDMKNSTDEEKGKIISAAEGNLGDNYNKVLWILDHSYIPNGNSSYKTSNEYISLMKKAGIEIENKNWDLTEDDIEVVQQMAIWYFTNNTGYTTLPSLYINGEQLSSIYYETDEYGQQFTGAKRQEKANELYKYFINNASSSYSPITPTLTLNNTNASVDENEDYYIAGPFTLAKENVSISSLEVKLNNVTLSSSNYQIVSSKTSTTNITNYNNLSTFYVKVPKSNITNNTTITVTANGTYNTKTLTFMTNTTETNQPVVLIKNEEKNISNNTNINIDLTKVNVEKIWEDNNNQDGIRPTKITVQLKENGANKGSTVELNSSNNWKHTWDKLLVGKTYTVDEIDVPTGYQKTVTGNATVGYTITNTHNPEKIQISVEKKWEDNNNQDGVRPTSIKVQLYANGNVKGENITLNSANSWKYTWTNLNKKESGTNIAYTVKELDENGNPIIIDIDSNHKKYNDDYTTVVYNVSGNKTTITNIHEPETIDITGTKTWEDNNDQDGKRPDSIVVKLMKGTTEVARKTVTESDNWTYSFANLQKYENGVEIKYTIDEKAVDEYTKTIDGYNIKNTYTPETTQVEGTKTWEDNNNQDGKRPDSIVVKLMKGTTEVARKTVTESDNWAYSFTNLQKYEDGVEIKYTIDEETVNGYTKTIDGYDITNTYTPGKVSKTVIKTWEDSNDEDTIRPRSVEVQLYKTVNETKTSMGDAYKVTLNESNNWKYTWTDLDEKENGINIIYSVEETNVPSGYTAKYSSNDYSNTDTITITNTHTVEAPTGKYNVVLRKVDNSGNELTGAKIKVNGKEYSVGKATIAKDVNITSTNPIILEYTLEEITAPEGYLGLSSTKDIKIKLEITKLDKTYKITRAYLVDGEGQKIASSSEINVSLDENTSTITINVINNPIQPEFDLALRKFITKINDETYSREPQVDTSTIATTGTATYKHTKEPLAVQVGDIVTYTIRVYNEGETDGYASQITDYLPEWLDFLPDDETNKTYLWTQDIDNNRKITTNITSKDSASGEELYNNRPNKQLLSAYDNGQNLDYIDVQIRCKVNEKAQVKQLITNIAEISEMQDTEGTEIITDRDSTKANVNLPEDIDLPNYKGKEENISDLTDENYYYKGQEDDDDFEKVIVENFDLSLRKFIVSINDKDIKDDNGKYIREPIVDTSKLGTTDENGNIITTATYNHPKTPIEVKNGDIVTYIIRIYNEGTLSGFANEVTDYIPEGLEFIEDSSINISNGWKVEDGKLVTNYLSDSNINNVINGVTENDDGGKELSYKDVEVQFKVVADPVEYADSIITNWAEISEDSNNDIDSTPGNNNKDEDDIDYEPIKLTYFDLALRKFITNVDGTDYNNRVPEVDTSKIGTIDEETGKKITTATYTHTKDPIVLETESTVIYTIRVYNEGTIAGYASEITDNIPEGLEFLPENETNNLYKWTMLDEESNITQDVSKAVKITTNCLSQENDSSNIISAYQNSNGNIALDYKDVKVAFKVTEPNTSDRIVVNTAQISKDSNDDIDSTPGNDVLTEDDIDREYVKVETFDLALQKWVTATKVTYNGKTKTTKTGFTADSTEMAKVDLVGKQLKKTTVKFVYCIRVINEGQVAGYATEIKDYVPSGLKFVAEDNKDWTLQKDGTVTTDKLKDTLLEPGQSATVEITLTWKNSSNNMGLKTNWAEISKDSGDDIDSTPDNYNKLEDDIDDAKVILSIKTGSAKIYIALAIISIAILGGGTFLIKKYVINK